MSFFFKNKSDFAINEQVFFIAFFILYLMKM